MIQYFRVLKRMQIYHSTCVIFIAPSNDTNHWQALNQSYTFTKTIIVLVL